MLHSGSCPPFRGSLLLLVVASSDLRILGFFNLRYSFASPLLPLPLPCDLHQLLTHTALHAMCLLKCLTCVFLAGLPRGGPRPRNLAADFHYLTGTLLVKGTRPMTSFSNCCIYKKYVMFYLNMLLNIVTYVGWSLYFDMFCFSWDLLRIHRNNNKPKANVKRLGSDWSRELTIMDTILLVKELWWVLLEN